MRWLVFLSMEAAKKRNEEISTALGYPDSSGTYTRYPAPIEHPEGVAWALAITTACDASAGVYLVRDVKELLSDQERASLASYEEMKKAGWFAQGDHKKAEPTP